MKNYHLLQGITIFSLLAVITVTAFSISSGQPALRNVATIIKNSKDTISANLRKDEILYEHGLLQPE